MPIGNDVIIDPTARMPSYKTVIEIKDKGITEEKDHEDYTIGDHVSIDYGFYCTAKLKIGCYVHIGPHCSVIGGGMSCFTMGNFTFLAAGCRVICASDEHLGEGIGIPWIDKKYRDNVIIKPVEICNGAGVCTNCVLMPGVVIPEGAIVGAGCVVRKSLEPWTIYIPGMGGEPMPVKERRQDKIKSYAKELGYDFSS